MSHDTETRLAWVRVPREDEVPEDVRALWGRADEKIGFVPNVLRTWALRPEHMLRWRKYMDELLKGASGLTEAQREMIGVVVSSTNRCYYCMTSHSGVLRALTGDPVLVDQLLMNYRHAHLDERESAPCSTSPSRSPRRPTPAVRRISTLSVRSAGATRMRWTSPKSPQCST